MNPAQKNRLEDLKARFLLHKGHLIQFVSNGHRSNFGLLDRITIDEDYLSLKLWLRYPPKDVAYSIVIQAEVVGQEFFSIYIDQFASCVSCKQKEAKPHVKREGGVTIDPSKIGVRGKA